MCGKAGKSRGSRYKYFTFSLLVLFSPYVSIIIIDLTLSCESMRLSLIVLFIFLTPGCPVVGMVCSWLSAASCTPTGTHTMWPFLHNPAHVLVHASLSSTGFMVYSVLFFRSSVSSSKVKEVQVSTLDGKTWIRAFSSAASP